MTGSIDDEAFFNYTLKTT